MIHANKLEELAYSTRSKISIGWIRKRMLVAENKRKIIFRAIRVLLLTQK